MLSVVEKEESYFECTEYKEQARQNFMCGTRVIAYYCTVNMYLIKFWKHDFFFFITYVEMYGLI